MTTKVNGIMHVHILTYQATKFQLVKQSFSEPWSNIKGLKHYKIRVCVLQSKVTQDGQIFC